MVTRVPRRSRRQEPASLLERCEPGIPHLRVIEGFSRVCQGLRVCRESVASLWRGLSKGCARGCKSFRESYGAHRAESRTPCASGRDGRFGYQEVCKESVERSARSSSKGLSRACRKVSAPLRESSHSLHRAPTQWEAWCCWCVYSGTLARGCPPCRPTAETGRFRGHITRNVGTWAPCAHPGRDDAPFLAPVRRPVRPEDALLGDLSRRFCLLFYPFPFSPLENPARQRLGCTKIMTRPDLNRRF